VPERKRTPAKKKITRRRDDDPVTIFTDFRVEQAEIDHLQDLLGS